jgi:hypothetical protein
MLWTKSEHLYNDSKLAYAVKQSASRNAPQ